MLCVESVRVLSLLDLIIVVYAIDVYLGWIIIVREYTLFLVFVCMVYIFCHFGHSN